jgi:Ser/Thr protein kinase RdoA (MazF antagonist)
MTTLSKEQRRLLREWLGDWETIEDLSWPLQENAVLLVRNHDGEHIVKASLWSHHIAREIQAHRAVLSSLDVRTPRLEHANLESKVLVTSYLPGELVLGTSVEWDPDTYFQAGVILSRIQAPLGTSEDYFDDVLTRIGTFFEEAVALVPHDRLEALKDKVERLRKIPVDMYFTHGDFQPRNWIIDEGLVSVIDFGRAAERSWVSDLVRLRNRQFVNHLELEEAFMAGVGRTLSAADYETLKLETVSESLGTVVWAHKIGDDEFEEHGRRMIARVLDSAT